ncbi:MAG: holin, partial [Sporomusa sp.]|nr:holin [Sporomusa sp.]
MSRYEFVYRGIAALFGAVMGYLFGGWSPLVSLLVTFVVIDYVTGMLA